MALVITARVSPRSGRARLSVSAAARKASSWSTTNTPARFRAAANTASAWPVGSSSSPPGRSATTGRRREAARAAEIKARRSRTRLMSSRIRRVSGSRERKSSTAANPTSALPPIPTTWLKPTPFGPAQSTTARASEADWVTRAMCPAGTGMWDSEAFSPSRGAATPNAFGPSTRTRAWRASGPRSASWPVSTAALPPAAPKAARSRAAWSPVLAITARSAAVAVVASWPSKPAAARLASTRAPSGVAAPNTAMLAGVSSRSMKVRLVRPVVMRGMLGQAGRCVPQKQWAGERFPSGALARRCLTQLAALPIQTASGGALLRRMTYCFEDHQCLAAAR